MAQKRCVLPWISDHFIQLIMRPNYPYTTADFYDNADIDNYNCLIYNCPFLKWMKNNCYTINGTQFTDYIEYIINQGYYLEANLDHYYFTSSLYYDQKHFVHPTFIYGYDNDKQIIYTSDFYYGKGYIRQPISYSNINLSLNNDYIINLYGYQDAEYKFNFELMNTYLEDYLFSRDSMKKFVFSHQEYNHNIY